MTPEQREQLEKWATQSEQVWPGTPTAIRAALAEIDRLTDRLSRAWFQCRIRAADGGACGRRENHPGECRFRALTYNQHDDLEDRAVRAEAEVVALKAENEKLAVFKAYVHKRLDEAGIPVDPPSKHREHGCRVGGRLDLAFAARAEAAELRTLLSERTHYCCDHGAPLEWCSACQAGEAWEKRVESALSGVKQGEPERRHTFDDVTYGGPCTTCGAQGPDLLNGCRDPFRKQGEPVEAKRPGQNIGHGWVNPRPDGAVARCGGPALCAACKRDAGVVEGRKQSAAPSPKGGEPEMGTKCWCGHVRSRHMGFSTTRATCEVYGCGCIKFGPPKETNVRAAPGEAPGQPPENVTSPEDGEPPGEAPEPRWTLAQLNAAWLKMRADNFEPGFDDLLVALAASQEKGGKP